MPKSDLFRRLFNDSPTEHTELSDYISSGVDQIIRGKVDPYYTIVKTKIKDYYLWSDTQIDEEYKTKMVERLNRMYFRATNTIQDTFEKNFLEICLEYVKENNTAISKSALSYLNELNKQLPK
jgi:folate-binding Fe-S cluster repair protein YgfZ